MPKGLVVIEPMTAGLYHAVIARTVMVMFHYLFRFITVASMSSTVVTTLEFA